MLNDRQIKHLRTLAHARKPVVMLGRHGLTEAVLEEIQGALDHHELIKVKVAAGDRTQRDAAVARICEETGALLVQRVGHVATLFRRNPEKPRVDLP
ncbi:ribosome assembly RNA-binding protein YhbY [Ectothiorhodospira mobilis]|uniref:ribosome assembly RNA-binding protein YhbY n=1 Tax=Ectothiorhodospira mobilis TaxID=195064 RepID=UPI001EE9A96F|nr:ribosome assembly RNA-binding protein YhbY [Ectothiorhodospira mobilis]MCG5535358.1 ribosome assembly RNA-binding protein YhbY [Ectothiorhodospira mobilis]